MQFGLMFFGSDEDALGPGKYDLVLDCARFADAHGFSSVWTPERHFTRLGSLFPNPAVLSAALATVTKRVRLRSGSVVLPLHDPLRVAEEWAMVDNLSGGRVDVSFASGWNPDDFAFFPDRYADRHERTIRGVETIRALWSGESVAVRSGTGAEVQVRIYPTPVQPSLGVFITAAGNPRTFVTAGEIGAHVLTHLLDQGTEVLAENIAAYRDARARHGHDPDAGQVSVMLHAFVGDQLEAVRTLVREPFTHYLKSNRGLLEKLAVSRGGRVDVGAMSAADVDGFADLLFERFFSTRALLGTPESCADLVARLAEIGVDEIACFLDFGAAPSIVLGHLPHLARLRERCSALTRARRPAQVPTSEPPRAPSVGVATPEIFSPGAVQARCVEEVDGDSLYDEIARTGLEYGPSLRMVRRLWRRDGEALGLLEAPANVGVATSAFFDGCVQILGAALPADERSSGAQRLLLAGVGSFRIHRAPSGDTWCHAVVEPLPKGRADVLEGDVRILGDTGELLVEARRLKLRRGEPAQAPTRRAPTRADLRERLLGVDPAERPRAVRAYLAGLVAEVSRVAASAIDPDQPLADLGFDSIMAIETKVRIEGELGIDLPLVLFLQDTTLARLAQRVAERLVDPPEGRPTSGDAPSASDPSVAVPSRNGGAAAWVQRPRPLPRRPRLFCVSYLAGGASAFRTWPAALAPDVEVCPIQLPGREDRLEDPPIGEMPALVEKLVEAIRPLLDRPYAFYGHSMGGLICFELTRRLRALGLPQPTHLIVANAAPHLRNPLLDALGYSPGKTTIPIGQLHPVLRRIGVRDVVLKNAELMNALLPVIEADVRLVHGYRHVEEAPLDCPILALKGARDEMVSVESVLGWGRHTRGRFCHQVLQGGHLFLDDDREALLQLVRDELRRAD